MSQPETEFLLTCLRPVGTPGAVLPAAVMRDIDWQRFMTLATNHHVIPLVYQALKHEPLLSASVRSSLRQAFMSIAAYNLRATHVLQRLQSRAREDGIALIPIKGPSLAILAYGRGHESWRQFEDLDLIVHRADMQRTITCLEAQGYLTHFLQSADKERAHYLKTDQDWVLRKEGDPLALELKPTLIWHTLSRCESTEWLARSCRPLPLDERLSLNAPGPEAMLLALCVDGTHDKWSKFSTVADIGQLLHAHPDANWGRLLQDANALGHRRALLIGVQLTSLLLEFEIPETFTAAISNDPKAQHLAKQEADSLRNDPTKHPRLGDLCVFAFRTRETFRDRLRFVVRLLFVPSITDIEDFHIPAILFPAYSLLRPFRLIRDVLKRSNKRPNAN